MRSAKILNVHIDPEGAWEIANVRGTPRIANRLLRRIRDYAQVKANGEITLQIAKEGLVMLDIDSLNLDADRKILLTMMDTLEANL